MKNDYYFWQRYLNITLQKIQRLLEEKDTIYADFHIHSDYSADSDQSLIEIVNRTKVNGFDIISITDHDSVKVYDELYDYLKENEIKKPIIVPGVEFTIDNRDYGSQFHILQLMINPKSKSITDNISYQEHASWIRAKKQFGRLEKNKAIQYFFKKYNIHCSLEKYKQYLKNCYRPIPEYKTIMEYLMSNIYKYNITNWNILEQMKRWNNTDKCLERKKIKSQAFKKLEDRFKNDSSSNFNQRFFHCLLAVRGADDDFFPEYECMGDLSVNDYNELKLDELNKDNMTFFAHPSENRLYLLKDLLKINDNVCGMEYNKRCSYSHAQVFYSRLKKLNLLKIVGSDSHDINNNLYDDINFYELSKTDVKKFIKKAEFYINNDN